MNRRERILESIDNLVRVHDEWERDENSPKQPTERFEIAVEQAMEVCSSGDIPSDCREVVSAMLKVGEEWSLYRNGQWDREQCPIGSFWNAFRSLVASRTGATVKKPHRPEPVSTLRAQKVSDLGIAKAYGVRDLSGNWTGPFFGENGQAESSLIDQEANNPGSVIPNNWVHPGEARRAEESRQEIETRLQNLTPAPQVTEDKASLEQCIKDGMYEHQILKAKPGVTIEEIRETAASLGVSVQSVPSITTERGRYDREITEAEHLAMPSERPEATEEAESELETVEELIHELADSDSNLGASEIASRVNDAAGERTVSVQKVAAILRKRKQAAAS